MPKLHCCLGLLLTLMVFSCCSMERSNNQQQRIKNMYTKIPLKDSHDSDESNDESDDDADHSSYNSKIIKAPLAKYLAVKRVIEGYEFHIDMGYETNKNNFFSLIRDRRNTKEYVCCNKKFTWEALKSHLRADHKRNGHYICCNATCHKKVKSFAIILSHTALHTHPNLFDCPFCDKDMKSEISIRRHFGLCNNVPEQDYLLSDNAFEEDVQVTNYTTSIQKSSGKDEASAHAECTQSSNQTMHAQVVPNVNNATIIAPYYSATHTNTIPTVLSVKDQINEVVAKCLCCGVELNSWLNGVNHFYCIHRIDSEYYCTYDKCYKRYARPDEALGCLVQHTHEHVFTCSMCKARYNTYQMILDHSDIHESENNVTTTRATSSSNIPYVNVNHVITPHETETQYQFQRYKSASDVVAEYQQPQIPVVHIPSTQTSWSEFLVQPSSYHAPQDSYNVRSYYPYK